jgi:hydroxyacylglutathione hydrolase
VVGYLAGGLGSLASRPELTATTERIAPALAAERLATGTPLAVDVRTPAERDQKQIAGSLGMPLAQLIDRIDEIPRDRPLIVHCAGGYRSAIAASLLQRRGFSQVSEIAGGIAAWETARLQIRHWAVRNSHGADTA